MTTYQLPFEIHQQLREELSEDKANKIASLLQNSINGVLEAAKDIAVQRKLEIKDEFGKELASKSDLKAESAEIELEVGKIKTESRVYFIVLICLLILLNRDSLQLIGQILGLIK